MKFCNNTSFILPKQSQRSRSILKDGSRFLGLFWKEKTPSYNQRNMIMNALSYNHPSLFLRGWLGQAIELCNTQCQVFLLQGGESLDLFRLFRTCIRTGPVRKLFIISLILNEFSCGDVHMSCLCNQQTNIEVFCAYAL